MYQETRHIEIADDEQPEWFIRLLRNLALLFPEIKQMILFGSAITDEMHRFSDMDLAIETTDNFTAQQWHQLTDQVHIAEKLRKIDCVHLKKVPADLHYAILAEGKILYVSR